MSAVTLWLAMVGCTAPCPDGEHADALRAERIASRLAEVPEGAALLAPGTPAICFGAAQSGVDPGGVIHLADASDGESAARLGHLLDHGVLPGAFTAGEPCDLQVDRAMVEEERAWALEGRLRAAFGVSPAVVGPELAALRADYTSRCRSLSGARRSSASSRVSDHRTV